MRTIHQYYLLICILMLPLGIQAKTSCRIDFQIKGLENNKIIFATQYGVKQLVVDTIFLNNEGKGFYESKERLVGGIFVVAFPSGKYFEVLINNEQFFSIITDTIQTMEHLIVEGSEETEYFRQYQVLIANSEKTRLSIKKGNDSIVNVSLKSEKKQIDSLKTSIAKSLPNSFIAKYFAMQNEPNLPDSLIKGEKPGKEIFIKRQQYRKIHYFDNVDFSDSRILRTRLLYEKLNYYFNILISQQADSICKEIDSLLAKTLQNEEAYRYILNFLSINYRLTPKPYQEKALIYLADNYYLNGKAPWADPRFIKLLQERTDALRSSVSGGKAANLNLLLPSGKPFELYSINSNYTILFFWSNDCKICISEANKLNDIYEKYKNKGIEILAIYVHADKNNMLDFISKSGYNWTFAYDPLLKSNFTKLYSVNTTPKLFLLDKNKVIIDKNLTTEALEMLFNK